MDDVKGLCERLESGALHSGHSSDWWVEYCRTIREASAALQSMAKELAEARAARDEALRAPVAFDPLSGGCPHCKWIDTNLGRVLDKKCDLHQKIEDMQADRVLDRRITKEQNDLIRRFCEAIGADEDEDPVKLAADRMGEIAELEAALDAAESAKSAEGVYFLDADGKLHRHDGAPPPPQVTHD